VAGARLPAPDSRPERPLVLVPQPYGEAVDRLVILSLKCERVAQPAGREAARRLHAALAEAWSNAGLPPPESLPEHAPLRAVNAELWEVEDALRACEREARFDERFVSLARRVYRANDERSALKRAIDDRLGSALVEPKDHSGALHASMSSPSSRSGR
jgi:hypothetical protein